MPRQTTVVTVRIAAENGAVSWEENGERVLGPFTKKEPRP